MEGKGVNLYDRLLLYCFFLKVYFGHVFRYDGVFDDELTASLHFNTSILTFLEEYLIRM